jgi:hypothetical protein
LLLDVLGHDQAGDGALILGDADGAIDAMSHGGGAVHLLHEFFSDILEQAREIDFLLKVAALNAGCGLTHNRDDRRVIHFCVI